MDEIERKWRLESYPKGSFGLKTERQKIRQVYASFNVTEVRLRERGQEYTITIKKGTPPRREERTSTISKKIFEPVWNSPLPKIKKKRSEWFVPLQYLPGGETSLTLEIDEFENGLLVGEIEFSSMESAERFESPEQFTEEVTTVPDYTNANIAQYGPPHPDGINSNLSTKI